MVENRREGQIKQQPNSCAQRTIFCYLSNFTGISSDLYKSFQLNIAPFVKQIEKNFSILEEPITESRDINKMNYLFKTLTEGCRPF